MVNFLICKIFLGFSLFCSMKNFSEEIFDYLKCMEANSFKVPKSDAQLFEVFHTFDVKGMDVIIVPVSLAFFKQGLDVRDLLALRRSFLYADTIFIYEDRWCAAGPLIRSMIDVRLGKGMTIYARNCEVRKISAEVAAEFLKRNHLYGMTRSEYRYGLFRKRATGERETDMMETASLVAVATFSAGRLFEDGTMSYEWIRYASVKGTRVVGGMGRLLDAFVKLRKQELLSVQSSAGNMDCVLRDTPAAGSRALQVMSYADMEWTTGESYLKLGFEQADCRESVEFLCDPTTMTRIHAGKFSTDRRFRSQFPDGYIRIYNLGSRKFIRKW